MGSPPAPPLLEIARLLPHPQICLAASHDPTDIIAAVRRDANVGTRTPRDETHGRTHRRYQLLAYGTGTSCAAMELRASGHAGRLCTLTGRRTVQWGSSVRTDGDLDTIVAELADWLLHPGSSVLIDPRPLPHNLREIGSKSPILIRGRPNHERQPTSSKASARWNAWRPAMRRVAARLCDDGVVGGERTTTIGPAQGERTEEANGTQDAERPRHWVTATRRQVREDVRSNMQLSPNLDDDALEAELSCDVAGDTACVTEALLAMIATTVPTHDARERYELETPITLTWRDVAGRADRRREGTLGPFNNAAAAGLTIAETAAERGRATLDVVIRQEGDPGRSDPGKGVTLRRTARASWSGVYPSDANHVSDLIHGAAYGLADPDRALRIDRDDETGGGRASPAMGIVLLPMPESDWLHRGQWRARHDVAALAKLSTGHEYSRLLGWALWAAAKRRLAGDHELTIRSLAGETIGFLRPERSNAKAKRGDRVTVHDARGRKIRESRYSWGDPRPVLPLQQLCEALLAARRGEAPELETEPAN